MQFRRPVPPPDVATVFSTYPAEARQSLLRVRKLIFEVAESTPGVGALDESLKWGEPAYATGNSKSGSTIRIAWKKSRPAQYAMYFNCQTTLVDAFKIMFPSTFRYEGNRALLFDVQAEVPTAPLRCCVEMALTYHARKRERI